MRRHKPYSPKLSRFRPGLARLDSRIVPAVFSNPAPIQIVDASIASPYPSTINVSGLTGQVITNLTVTLKGFTHDSPEDVDILLVGPTGKSIVLMSDNGGLTPVAGLSLSFTDAAAGTIGKAAISSGSYQPENIGAGDAFPGAPGAPPVSKLADFIGTDPNGNWELRIVDDTFLFDGSISLGWEIDITSKANNAPVANPDTYNVDEDTVLNVSAAKGVLQNDTDADLDPLNAILVSSPANGTLTLNADGSFVYVPTKNFNGSDSFAYRANDGITDSGVAKVTITVNPVDDAPVTVGDRYVTLQNTPLTIDAASGLLRNDLHADAAPLTRLFFEDFEGFTLKAFQSPSTVGQGDGSGQDWTDLLPAGWTNDLTTTPIGDPIEYQGWRILNIDSWIGEQSDQGRSQFLRGGVGKAGRILVADGDAYDDGTNIDPFEFKVLGTTRPISLAGVMPGTVRIEFDSSFFPENQQSGAVEVTFDGGASWTTLLTLDTAYAGGNNDNPSKINERVSLLANNPDGATNMAIRFTYQAGNNWWWAIDNLEVTGNRTNFTTISAVKVTNPANGKLSLSANGAFTYTPNSGFTGDDSFTYRANDGVLDGKVETVVISVVAANAGVPVGNSDRYSMFEGGSLNVVDNFGVLANDTDFDGDPLFAQLVAKPANGTLTLNSSGSFIYTPSAKFIGTDSFTYKASDGVNVSATTTVTIRVIQNNFNAPVANDDTFAVNEYGSLTISAPGLLQNDTDADGNSLTSTLVTGPNHGKLSLNADGSFTYSPFPGYSGPDTFTYQAKDNQFSSAIATVTINVTEDPAPFAVPDTYTTTAGAKLTIPAAGLLANDRQDGTLVTLLNIDFEGFNMLPFSPGVPTGANADGTDWSQELPAGWTLDNTTTPPGGPEEFFGWHLMDVDSWISQQGDQARSDFKRGGVGLRGTIAVADGDAYDDFIDIDPVANRMNTLLSTGDISLAGILPNSLLLEFDSSYRPEDPQFGRVEVSYDSGATWTTLSEFTTANSGGNNSRSRTNERVGYAVSNPSGGTARFRFTYNAGNNWWWAIDNVRVTGESGTPNLTAVKVTDPANGSVTVSPDGSFVYTPNPSFFGIDTFTYSAVSGSYVSAPAVVSINVQAVGAPIVTGVKINDGSAQRSRVTSLTVGFNQVVTFTGGAAAAFSLVRQSDLAAVTLAATVDNSLGYSVVTLSGFTGAATDFKSLADGRYTLTVNAALVSNANGQLDGDADGTGGDNYVFASAAPPAAATNIFRLFGDADGNGTVNAADFLAFRLAFLSNSPTFDSDNNGTVDAADFLQFRLQFLKTI